MQPNFELVGRKNLALGGAKTVRFGELLGRGFIQRLPEILAGDGSKPIRRAKRAPSEPLGPNSRPAGGLDGLRSANLCRT
jgi:hypothetical protein